MIVSVIVAMAGPERAIGNKGGLPWRLPADMAHFKRLTMGHHVIMGRRTYQSLPTSHLPGRRIIVLSRSGLDSLEHSEDVRVAGSLQEALQLAETVGESEAFIAGGAAVYAKALDQGLVDRMYLTLVEAEVEADTFFPSFDPNAWKPVERRERPADEPNAYDLTFIVLERRV